MVTKDKLNWSKNIRKYCLIYSKNYQNISSFKTLALTNLNEIYFIIKK